MDHFVYVIGVDASRGIVTGVLDMFGLWSILVLNLRGRNSISFIWMGRQSGAVGG